MLPNGMNERCSSASALEGARFGTEARGGGELNGYI